MAEVGDDGGYCVGWGWGGGGGEVTGGRAGIGVDVHPFAEGRPLVLGGVRMAFDRGLEGHSDGDVLCHAIIDALLGAAGMGDIGSHFPSSDPANRGADSLGLLARTVEIIGRNGWKAAYVDATILAEKPAVAPARDAIEASLAGAMQLSRSQVSVKATTTDGLGFTGRGEGICAMAVATIEPA